MRIVSFDPLRTWDIPNVVQIKPEQWEQSLPKIKAADWVLFPEHWQINTLALALQKRIFPSLNSYHLGYSKAEMTYAMQAVFPNHMPYTRILPRTDSARDAILHDFSFPFVAKEVRNARGQGVFLIENRADLDAYIAQNGLLYVQEYLPIGRDLRIVVVGREVVVAYWRTASEGMFHNNVSRGGVVSFDDVDSAAIDFVQTVARTLDINHAGFDVAMVDGQPHLLEFNMRFGNAALKERNLRLGDLILRYLESQTEQLALA